MTVQKVFENTRPLNVSLKQHHLEQAGLPWGPACSLFKRLETAGVWRLTTTSLLIRRSPTLHQVWTHSHEREEKNTSKTGVSLTLQEFSYHQDRTSSDR